MVPRQNIIFLCKRNKQPNFAVWIDADFELAHHYILQPLKIQCLAALVPEAKTLAELLLESKGEQVTTLDWCKKIHFGNEDLNLSATILAAEHNFQQLSRWRLTVEIERLGQLDTQKMIRNVPEIPRKEQFGMPQRSEIEAWMTELTSPPKRARLSVFRRLIVASPLWEILSWF